MVHAEEAPGKTEPIDPAGLNFCGYTCPPDCKMREATLAGDIQLKQEAFDAWKLEERYGVDFDPDQTICYGCKAEGKPEGTVVSRCTVRACVQERKLDCCIECDELKTCDKDLWKRFAEFHKQVIQMQEKYRAQS
jgi:hypothetical protein